MTPLQHYQVSLWLNTAVTATLGVWIYLKRRNSRVAQLFCLYSLLVGFWSWCQAWSGLSLDPAASLAWSRAAFCVIIAFPALLTEFFLAFLQVNQRKACRLGWLLVAGSWPWIFSDALVREGGPLGFLPCFPRGGPLFFPYNVIWVAWIIYDLWLLLEGARQAQPRQRRAQIRMLLVAFVFGYLTGITNYLYWYGIVIPWLQPYATYGVPVAFLLIAYGVFAYGLFDIQIVVRKSLVYSLLVTLLTIGYFGLVYIAERAFQTTWGYQSIGVSLAAFALMALAFQPLKIGVQRLVDWVFFRAPREELVKQVEGLEQEVRQADKIKAVATMAAGLAHEIRNPMTAIQTFLRFLPEKYDDPEFRKLCSEIVVAESDRVNDLLTQLLDFAKPKPLTIQPTDVHHLIQSTLEFLSNEALRRRVQVRTEFRATDPTVPLDPNQMRQVLLNLATNGLKAMQPSGVLTVATAQQNGTFCLEVRDTGCGIPAKDLPHLFEPFFSKRADGHGLGLSIVHSIIQEHHGTISVASTLGQGTTFTVRLPMQASP